MAVAAPAPSGAGSTRTAARPAAAPFFGLASGPAELAVHGGPPGLREAVAGLLHPLIEVRDAAGPSAPRLTVAERADLPLPPAAERDAAPRLLVHPDGPRYTVLDRGVVLRDGERDSAPLLLTAGPRPGDLLVETAGGGTPAVRALVRLLKTLLGDRLTGHSAVFLHGSAVARDGASVLMLGPKHRGKSSLAFLAVTLCGEDFVSDDTVVCGAPEPGAAPLLRGWPKRIGIGTSLLAGHPAREAFERAGLRRHGPGGASGAGDGTWSTDPANRVRLFADLDEFAALTGAAIATGTRPAGVVLPHADRDRRGWHVEPAAGGAELAASVMSGNDLRDMTDHLGLLPAAVPVPGAREAVLEALHAVPCVRVSYGPDVNADFPRFWAEVTAALGLPGRER
jgi:hypothetical protein